MSGPAAPAPAPAGAPPGVPDAVPAPRTDAERAELRARAAALLARHAADFERQGRHVRRLEAAEQRRRDRRWTAALQAAERRGIAPPAAPRGGARGRLGTTTNNFSRRPGAAAEAGAAGAGAPPGPVPGAPDAGRHLDRYRLREVLWRASTLPRVCACGRRRVDGAEPVPVFAPGEPGGAVRFGNVQLCGSVWACPVCASKIRQKRAEEIAFIVAAHMDGTPTGERGEREGGGGGALFLTLTMPHDFGDGLAALLETTAKAWASVLGGKGIIADRDRFGIVDQIRATDLTCGPNGWHPHLHCVLLTAAPLSAEDRAELEARIYGRWAGAVERRGYRRPARYGKDGKRVACLLEAVECSERIGEYVTKLWHVETSAADGSRRKLGLEMARHDMKAGRGARHRTPFELLADYARAADKQGERAQHDLARWREYENATKGKRAVGYSKGLKRRFGVDDHNDAELARAADKQGPQVASIAPPEWSSVTRRLGGVTAVAGFIVQGEPRAARALASVLRTFDDARALARIAPKGPEVYARERARIAEAVAAREREWAAAAAAGEPVMIGGEPRRAQIAGAYLDRLEGAYARADLARWWRSNGAPALADAADRLCARAAVVRARHDARARVPLTWDAGARAPVLTREDLLCRPTTSAATARATAPPRTWGRAPTAS